MGGNYTRFVFAVFCEVRKPLEFIHTANRRTSWAALTPWSRTTRCDFGSEFRSMIFSAASLRQTIFSFLVWTSTGSRPFRSLSNHFILFESSRRCLKRALPGSCAVASLSTTNHWGRPSRLVSHPPLFVKQRLQLCYSETRNEWIQTTVFQFFKSLFQPMSHFWPTLYFEPAMSVLTTDLRGWLICAQQAVCVLTVHYIFTLLLCHLK